MTLQDTEARLALLTERQAGVGGSDIGALAGLDPYRNAYDIYLEKTRPPTADQARNIHILRGLMLEDLAATLYSERSGRKVRRLKQRAHPDYPWAMVNADRQILRSDGNGAHASTGAMEIKAPATAGFQRLLDEGAQVHHSVQLHWAMWVLGYDWGEFVAINLEHSAGPLVHHALDRNDDLIEQVAEAADRFWNDHVLERIPPTPDVWPYYQNPVEVPAHDAAVIKYGDDRDWDATYEWLLSAHAELDTAKKQYEAAKAQAMEFAGDMKIKVTGDQGSVSVYWGKGRTSISASLVEAIRPIDPDKLHRTLKAWDELPVEIDHVLRSCALDLDNITTVGDAYQAVRVTPKKKKGASE
jgi:putative phage-type endonuclease